MRTSAFQKEDEATYLWFLQQRPAGVPLTGPLIRAQAVKLNGLLDGPEKFMASNGGFGRWKKRHSIRMLAVTGEKLSADTAAAEDFVKQFVELVADYSPQQIYSADESGLNITLLPNKSFVAKDEKCAPGFKMSKERVTILACANAAGTHKLPLMLIGKSKKPRALKDENMNCLPVFYRHQKKAWMNSELSREWVKKEVLWTKKFCSS